MRVKIINTTTGRKLFTAQSMREAEMLREAMQDRNPDMQIHLEVADRRTTAIVAGVLLGLLCVSFAGHANAAIEVEATHIEDTQDVLTRECVVDARFRVGPEVDTQHLVSECIEVVERKRRRRRGK